MLQPCLRELLAISSPALLNADVSIESNSLKAAGDFASSLADVLRERNGFFALEGAFHFFPFASVPISYGLPEWNDENLWRSEYGDLSSGCFFFAEDIFGGQFCVFSNAIFTFDPETGRRSFIANSLEGWAEALLADYDVLTGHRLAHEWQLKYRKLSSRERLVPKVPFVVGGKFDISNLVAIDAVKGMRARGNLARQIRDLPDGAQIRFEVTD